MKPNNNYWVNVEAADLYTGQYYPNARVRRFHDSYRNETVILNIGVTGKKYADKLLFGFTAGENKADIQTGARMTSVFGQVYSKGNIVLYTNQPLQHLPNNYYPNSSEMHLSLL